MATIEQLANAERLDKGLRNVVVTLKGAVPAINTLTGFYNSLSDNQKTALCNLRNLDRAQVDTLMLELSTLATSITTLPKVDSTF